MFTNLLSREKSTYMNSEIYSSIKKYCTLYGLVPENKSFKLIVNK